MQRHTKSAHRYKQFRAKVQHPFAPPTLATMLVVLAAASLPGATLPNEGAVPNNTGALASQVADSALAARPSTQTAGLSPTARNFGLPGQGKLPLTIKVTSPTGVRTVTESITGVHQIPLAAVNAYQRAASVLTQVDPACQLPWTLLAAVGRVESDHGRYGRSHLGVDGVSRPLIRGPRLNGVGPLAKIADSDGGALDGDKVWDRAVGPMQFIPSTWVAAGVDGDGDGVRSPNDIDDAALAAAVYLCANTAGLQAPANMRAALRHYNNSASYVALVMAYERSYRNGSFTVSTGSIGTTPIGLAASSKALPAEVITRARVTVKRHSKTAHFSAQAALPVTKPHPRPSPTTEPGTSTPPPNTTPDPPSNPTPPADDPDPVTPEPAPVPAPKEAPDPGLVSETGVWETCGPGFCLSGNALDLGPADLQTSPAVGDFDGDGVIEENGAEFAGLVNASVTLTVAKTSSGWVVFGINEYEYLLADGTPAQPARSAPPS